MCPCIYPPFGVLIPDEEQNVTRPQVYEDKH